MAIGKKVLPIFITAFLALTVFVAPAFASDPDNVSNVTQNPDSSIDVTWSPVNFSGTCNTFWFEHWINQTSEQPLSYNPWDNGGSLQEMFYSTGNGYSQCDGSHIHFNPGFPIIPDGNNYFLNACDSNNHCYGGNVFEMRSGQSILQSEYLPDYTSGTATPTPTPVQLTSVNPAKVWIGLKNSDDVGIKFDLKAEVYKGNTLITSGILNSVAGGSSGFNNAHAYSIPFDSFSAVAMPSGSQLSVTVYERNACTGSGHNSGTARLWYSDNQADTKTAATIGENLNTYYLLGSSVLSTTVGAGPKQTVDVAAGAKCSAYKSFGTWSITL